MEPIEIQKRKFAQAVKDERLVSEELAELLNVVEQDSVVLEIGGIGFVAEYLSSNCNVSLCEENPYSYQYRKHIVPESKVQFINLNPFKLNFSTPVYDYVIISEDKFMDVAKTHASKAVINLNKKEVIYADDTGVEPVPEVQEKKAKRSSKRSNVEPVELPDIQPE